MTKKNKNEKNEKIPKLQLLFRYVIENRHWFCRHPNKRGCARCLTLRPLRETVHATAPFFETATFATPLDNRAGWISENNMVPLPFSIIKSSEFF
jgi:hypothetical protein